MIPRECDTLRDDYYQDHRDSQMTVCPNCGEHFIPKLVMCDIRGCRFTAEFSGWTGDGVIKKVKVCRDHARLLKGYETHREEFGL
jgi:predicted RNA-binding Zn-ribbon protein involved in translation (DUF1610 family)